MPILNEAHLRHQQSRWLKPNAARWVRPDPARFFKPGTKLEDVFPALALKYSQSQPPEKNQTHLLRRDLDREPGERLF